MKCLFLNLPYPSLVMRRYMCSYNTRHFLFPPLELMYLASIVKGWKHGEAILVDAVVEKLNVDEIGGIILKVKPDILITLIGFETFDNDMESINYLKKVDADLKIIAIGYYPTLFPETVLKNSGIDIIIKGEPELIFSQLYDCLANQNRGIFNVRGLAYRDSRNDIIVTSPSERLSDLDGLPFPDYSLIDVYKYSEIFMKKPFATILSSRGCPFACGYCVKTYGEKTVQRSSANVLEELEGLVIKNGIKSVRFLDDTFTINKNRVIELCKGMIEKRIKIEWSCLSRLDTLDQEILYWMKSAGCKRILVGVESGSQRVLDYYGKNYAAEKIKITTGLIKKEKIECVGWFIVGGTFESDKDFNKTVEIVKKNNFDLIAVSTLSLYPGTGLFEKHKEETDFSLFPYRNMLKDSGAELESLRREKFLYRIFYLSPFYIQRGARIFLKNPIGTIILAISMLIFIFKNKIAYSKRKDLL